MKAEWANRTATPFAEAAEVLGVDTDLIMALMERDDSMYVLYSPNRETAEDPDSLLGCVLARDDDDVLRMKVEPMPVPEASQALKQLRNERP
jgi:hypothetical protein